MSAERLKKDFVEKYVSEGEDKFYRYLLLLALKKLILINKGNYRGSSPHLELLECYNQFLSLYRKEGEDIYLQMARTFRKVAHRIYRIMLKKDMIKEDNKFLNLV